MRKWISLFLSLMMVGAVLCGCGDGSGTGDEGSNGLQDQRRAANEVAVAVAEDLTDLDPHASSTAGTKEVFFNIYEGLVKVSPDGELIPAVAQSYDISPDGLTYSFTLRDGVTFHNGAPVSAEDVLFSLNRCRDSSKDAALVSALSVICDLRAEDERTVTFRLEQPDPELINFLSVAIVPQDYADLATHPMGTGPFRFVSASPQESFVMERYDGYWGAAPTIEKVTYHIFTDGTAMMMALKGGAVDLCAHLTAAQVSDLGAEFRVLEGSMNLVQAVYLNHDYAPLSDVRVRRALCYALDRQTVMDVVADGHGLPLGSSIYPRLGKYFLPELTERYPTDVEKAKSLLAEAGYGDGFTLDIAVISSMQPHMDTAEVIVQQLAAIGVEARVVPMDSATWNEQVYKGRQFQATITGLAAKNTTARDMLERFTSDNGKNFINYRSEEYDALYRQARAAADESAQREKYLAMETLLSQDAANIYIQDLADLVAIRADLQGFTFYPVYVQDMSRLYYE